MTVAWLVPALVAVPIALFAAARWISALAARAPVLYGEGAVANAALLARDRLEYADPPDRLFTAANYPPLYFHLAALGDPFVSGRLLSIAATLFVAGAIAYRARRGGALLAVVLAASWIATAPVAVWGPALKPDLVALALTVGAVLAADARTSVRDDAGALVAGALAALAIWAKPTAALPALALVVFLLATDRRGLTRFVVGAVLAPAIAMPLTHLPDADMLRHVVEWNALPWSAEQAVLLGALGLFVAGITLVTVVVLRPRGAVLAYGIGALGVVALGGREGATFNYLLDLLAAAWLIVAAAAPRLRAPVMFPLGLAAQTLVAVALFDPLGILSARAISTGAWERGGRVDVVHAVPGKVLVEDSGLLVADGRAPAVDDVFLWSRLQDRRHDTAVLDAIRRGTFDAVIAEADLGRLDAAPLWERQRWHDELVAAIASAYRFEREDHGLFVYVRR